jgi:hypothetical protein
VRALGILAVGAVFLFCCARVAAPGETPSTVVSRSGPSPSAIDASSPPLEGAKDLDASSLEASLDATLEDDPMSLHYEAPEALRALMGEARSVPFPLAGPWRLGQGNRAISQHAIGRRACLEGLRDVVVQTPEQRALCGSPNMVPVWARGSSAGTARFCIDVFEFPNAACELPFVFVTPFQAKRICEAQGKRLCGQDEWNLACRGDPDGGGDRLYAYGDDLDLAICNTNKSRVGLRPPCDVSGNEKLWTTCGTNTEPSGAFPQCRSRFGVFDQHGNVAEIMTRVEAGDGGAEVKSQLKGSAFFYVDVAKKPNDPGGYWTRYPDHCNFDPRWHVEPIETAGHMNYHLGFRCCKSVGSPT